MKRCCMLRLLDDAIRKSHASLPQSWTINNAAMLLAGVSGASQKAQTSVAISAHPIT